VFEICKDFFFFSLMEEGGLIVQTDILAQHLISMLLIVSLDREVFYVLFS